MRTAAARFVAPLRACAASVWPAWLAASLLILWGFWWSMPHAPHLEKSFHADENAAIWGVRQIHFPGFNPHLFNWGTALLYQAYLLKMLFSLGGLTYVGDAKMLLIGRAIVWLCALGTIACVYLLCRDLFGEWTARAAALILSVMPGFIVNSHYFKTDIPMAFWFMATLLIGYRVLGTGGMPYVYWLGLLAGYTISSKYSGAPVLLSGLLCILLSPGNLKKFQAILIFGVCTGAGFLIGTPRVLPDPTEFLATLRWVAGNGKAITPWALANGPGWSDYLTRVAQLSMTLPVWIAAFAGLVWLTIRRTRIMLPIWAFLAAYAFVLNADNNRLVRYLAPLFPLAAMAAAGLLGGLRQTGSPGRLAAMAGAAVLIGYSFLYTAGYVRVMAEEDPRVQAGNWIAQHAPRDVPFPVSTAFYMGAPQVQLWGFQKLEVQSDLAKLRAAASPWLAVSEYLTEKYAGAVDRYPEVAEYFNYLRANYTEVAHFENSQRLLWIDSKNAAHATHDWLYPNPRITIYRRRESPRL